MITEGLKYRIGFLDYRILPQEHDAVNQPIISIQYMLYGQKYTWLWSNQNLPAYE